MSKAITTFLDMYPLLTTYAQMGLVNITSLAQHIKETASEVPRDATTPSIAMTIRRHLAQLPKKELLPLDLPKQPLHFVIRSTITEFIFTKTEENRKKGHQLFQEIIKTKHFSCLVEGEKEIVLITDHPHQELIENNRLDKKSFHHTQGLGFISIDLPIHLREVVGVYSRITTVLAAAQISIHSFHTIGGEILILVKDEDLVKAQEVLRESI